MPIALRRSTVIYCNVRWNTRSTNVQSKPEHITAKALPSGGRGKGEKGNDLPSWLQTSSSHLRSHPYGHLTWRLWQWRELWMVLSPRARRRACRCRPWCKDSCRLKAVYWMATAGVRRGPPIEGYVRVGGRAALAGGTAVKANYSVWFGILGVIYGMEYQYWKWLVSWKLGDGLWFGMSMSVWDEV